MMLNVPSQLLYRQQLMLSASVAVCNVQFIVRHNSDLLSLCMLQNIIIIMQSGT